MRKAVFFILFFAVVSLTAYSLQLTAGEACAQDSSKEEESLFVAKKAFEDGFYEVSRGLLERFIAGYPGSAKIPDANLLIGQCYFYQDKFLDALAKFEELSANPGARQIRDAVFYWIAEVHFKGSAFAQAGRYYQKVIDEFPKSSYIAASYYSLGWCFFNQNDFARALDYFKAVEEKFPKEPQAQDASFKIVECLYSQKDYPALKSKAKAMLKVYSRDPVKLSYLNFYIAEADYYMNNFSDAVSGYEKVTASSVDSRVKAVSQLGTGWSYLKLKKYKEAEDLFASVSVENLERKSIDVLLLGRAILYLETGRVNEARDAYGELLSAGSEPVVLQQAYLGKADLLYGIGEYAEAAAVYQEALAKADAALVPQELIDKLHYGLAWAFLKKGDFREAIGEFQRLVRHTEDQIVKVSALCHIGDAYQDSGEYDKAIEAYDKILKDYPDNLYGDYVQYQLGLTLLKAYNYDAAIMAFQNLKKNYPSSKLLDDASYALGLVYFQKEDYGASRDIFEKFPAEFKDSSLASQAAYLLGTSLYNQAKYREAIEAFKDVIRLYGHDQELAQKAEYEIADCFDQMGDEEEAMSRFNALRSKYPDSKLTPEVMWWLGQYYYRHNDLTMARRYFSSLVQDFPGSNLLASVYYVLGSTYDEEAKYEEAVNNFNKVLESDKTDLAGTAAIAIADIYMKQGKFDSALLAYKETALKHKNLLHLIYPKIAGAYRRINDYELALEFYRKGLEVVPVRQIAELQFNIADTLEAQDKAVEAIEEYLKVTYLYPENSGLTVKSLLRVAAIYEKKEDYKEALKIYQRVNAMGVEEAKFAQERVEWIKGRVR